MQKRVTKISRKSWKLASNVFTFCRCFIKTIDDYLTVANLPTYNTLLQC